MLLFYRNLLKAHKMLRVNNNRQYVTAKNVDGNSFLSSEDELKNRKINYFVCAEGIGAQWRVAMEPRAQTERQMYANNTDDQDKKH